MSKPRELIVHCRDPQCEGTERATSYPADRREPGFIDGAEDGCPVCGGDLDFFNAEDAPAEPDPDAARDAELDRLLQDAGQARGWAD